MNNKCIILYKIFIKNLVKEKKIMKVKYINKKPTYMKKLQKGKKSLEILLVRNPQRQIHSENDIIKEFKKIERKKEKKGT